MQKIYIPTMAELFAKGEKPEILFWVGCAGSFDERAKRITRAFATLLHRAGVRFAVLGTEEGCTGDPAKRAGNEFLFQMQALTNIQVLDNYEVTKIVTTCPHCFNTIKNEYPSLGGNYQVLHHTQLLQQLLDEGRLKVEGGFFKGKRITFHDPCYLGRANNEYEAPRSLLETIEAQVLEMKKCKAHAMCCGAGGAQMFKEAEAGNKEINIERTEQALDIQPDIIATGCPFCNTMFSDGLKFKQKTTIQVKDIAEILVENSKLNN
ncbi:Fe-S oxidoreductase [Capnocytophaga catalasegens]|uniref:Fe-S oxidoreductase n=2 Tax=Capnocytophaga catalasegens TaxID=1004260 RepID=A0AAV5AZX3_9FLAO|nr:(Fe-S)-binding protein [Capnocytophaga catalasegens]GIZ14777.1 Fe-S oxidoreductase [Capnocytophaga catalasegens]GJM51145.1 Fe-S oxidoreductase [Capnocytophaga catalasegens]GJM53544.1 Fe-S oxidoreductase [Capnocytophaga catalasegens]